MQHSHRAFPAEKSCPAKHKPGSWEQCVHAALSRRQWRSPASTPLPHLPPINCSDIHKEGWGEYLQACSCQALMLNPGQVTKFNYKLQLSTHKAMLGAVIEPLSAAPALAGGSDHSRAPPSATGCSRPLQPFARALALLQGLCTATKSPQVSRWSQTAICFNCSVCWFLHWGGAGGREWLEIMSLLCSCSHWFELQGEGMPVESGKSKTDVSKDSYIASVALYSALCTSPCPNWKILLNLQAPRTLQHYFFSLLLAEGSTSTL